jgi:hypothetical protein
MSLTLIRSRIMEHDVISKSVSEFPVSKFGVELLCVFGSGLKFLYHLLTEFHMARCLRRVLHTSEHKVRSNCIIPGTPALLRISWNECTTPGVFRRTSTSLTIRRRDLQGVVVVP